VAAIIQELTTMENHAIMLEQAVMQVSEHETRLKQIVAKVPGLLFQMRQASTGLIQFSFLSEGCEMRWTNSVRQVHGKDN